LACGYDAIFGTNGTGGAVTLASPTAVNSLTFNSFGGTYTLGTAGQTLTLTNGITVNAGAGVVSIISPIALGADQIWMNGSTNTLTASGAITNNGYLLTIDGTGPIALSGALSGAGGLTKNGDWYLTMRTATHTFSAPCTINGGTVLVNDRASLGSGNLVLNGGVMEIYWNTTITSTLGAGPGQIQITGGSSGFGENGNAGGIVTFNNNAAFELVWGMLGEGAATGYFNPSALVLQVPSAQANSMFTLSNKIDLNGTTRTIAQNKVTVGTGLATMSGVIRNSTGTAGIIKTSSLEKTPSISKITEAIK